MSTSQKPRIGYKMQMARDYVAARGGKDVPNHDVCKHVNPSPDPARCEGYGYAIVARALAAGLLVRKQGKRGGLLSLPENGGRMIKINLLACGARAPLKVAYDLAGRRTGDETPVYQHAYATAWRKRNKRRLAKYGRAYRAAHPQTAEQREKALRYGCAYREAHRAELRAAARKYYQETKGV